MVERDSAIILDIAPPEPATPEEIAMLPKPTFLYHNSPRSYCGICRTITENTPAGKCLFCDERMNELSPMLSDTLQKELSQAVTDEGF